MRAKYANMLMILAAIVGAALLLSMIAYSAISSTHATNVTQSNSTYIYCVGTSGHGNENLTFYAPLNASGIGKWQNTTSYPVGVDDVGCDIYHGYIYCTGTNATVYENESYYAKLSPSGIGNWTATTPYPFPVSYQSCSAYSGYIYCVGDWWYPKQNATEYAPISEGGIGQWVNTTPYPQPFYWGTCAINNGYIYCVGGGQVEHAPGAKDGDVFQIIGNRSSSLTFFASVSSKGIGTWKETTPYPTSFTLDGCSIYNSYIYCLGGEGGMNNMTFYAHVSSSGIGNWTRTTDTPIPFIQTGCDMYNGHIYCIGSRDNSTAGRQTWYAPILSKGGIGNWTATTPFPIPFYGDSYCEIPGSGGGWTSGGGPED